MKVTLTGSTGFTGSHTLTELQEHGHEVTVLVRDDAQADRVAAIGATPTVVDLHDRPTVTSKFSTADGAIHTASPGDATSANLDPSGRRGDRRFRGNQQALSPHQRRPDLRVREARDPEAYVNFSASGMPLVRLAELFDDLFPGQILMPVSKMQEKVTTDEELRQIKLGDLGEYLGLCRSGRRCRDVPPRPPTPRSENPASTRRRTPRL